jgi:hypothetical protein
MGKRITWDENELEALADAVAKLRIDLPHENLSTLLNRVQKTVLEPDRQRKISTYKQAGPEFMKLLKRSLTDKMTGAITAGATKTETIIEYNEPDEDAVLIGCSTTQLTNELVARFFHWVDGVTASLGGVGSQPRQQVERIVERTIQPASKADVVLARFGVAGLSAAHFRALQNRLGASADLRFMQQQRPMVPPTVEFVIVVGSAKRYWKTFESDRVKFCEQGGLSDVTAFIKKLLPPSSIG